MASTGTMTSPMSSRVLDVTEPVVILGSIVGSNWLTSAGDAIHALMAFVLVLMGIIQGYISIRRYQWDRRDHEGKRK